MWADIGDSEGISNGGPAEAFVESQRRTSRVAPYGCAHIGVDGGEERGADTSTTNVGGRSHPAELIVAYHRNFGGGRGSEHTHHTHNVLVLFRHPVSCVAGVVSVKDGGYQWETSTQYPMAER